MPGTARNTTNKYNAQRDETDTDRIKLHWNKEEIYAVDQIVNHTVEGRRALYHVRWYANSGDEDAAKLAETALDHFAWHYWQRQNHRRHSPFESERPRI